MYIPKHFEQPSIESTHEFVEAYPFATLVTLRPDGLCGDQIPMQLNKAPQPYGTLVGHVARANPVWQFADGKEVLVIFRPERLYLALLVRLKIRDRQSCAYMELCGGPRPRETSSFHRSAMAQESS